MAIPIIKYHPCPDDHFLYHPPRPGTLYHIADLIQDGYMMNLYINPTDARKRLILRFVGKYFGEPSFEIKNSLNRAYTPQELEAFYKCVAKLMFKFQPLGVQLSCAGNNSQSVEDGVIVIGNKEPSMLHVHLVMKFLLPLDQIGKEFSLMGPKEKWTDEEAIKFNNLISTYL
ncbi:Hypothetical protein HVR_LOCUS691 [uncultured virus]|nr:Hypothetical protein HVR_LOCUS691 [uncultured virus]